MLSSKTVEHSPSPYHQIAVVYCRNVQGDLLAVTGPCKTAFEESWASPSHPLKQFVLSSPATPSTIGIYRAPEFKHIQREPTLDSTGEKSCTNVYEYRPPNEDQIRGIVAQRCGTGAEKSFFRWFIKLVLTSSHLDLCAVRGVFNHHSRSLAQEITELFSKKLRNAAPGDMWNVGGGKEYFEDRVLFYTSRNAAIRMVLPAFPCKSTSPDKVLGDSPDKGEELALRSIYNFIQETKTIYPPGVEFSIVSDGHVFSDCGK